MRLPWSRRGTVAVRRGEAEAARRIEELTTSRRAIVDAYEVERRRIERDLHDGAQQYLVAAAMKLGEAQLATAVAQDPQLAALLTEARRAVQDGLDALRHTVRGVHPRMLEELGLAAAVTELAARSPLPVRVVCPHLLPIMPEGVVAAAYFLVAEALTNVAKYAPESNVTILLAADESLNVSVVDDGPGGVRVQPGHGLAGMAERLAAFGGTLEVLSPVGGPTQVVGRIPLLLRRGESALGAGVFDPAGPSVGGHGRREGHG